ncbi:hypothetical protein GCN78_03610 [Janthinobacterium rivuli]|uniref:hypothetical protein n=1 Tax=Janthinobacterium sp. FT68W TaxID=2654255 RepID=UPI001264EF69|nr:hypothetical protein [Janthinobacterium sp. FT68W]KAB8054767.1 hypothetical protein GCN78_03610 [Janthinobacterium sp. FT68W]
MIDKPDDNDAEKRRTGDVVIQDNSSDILETGLKIRNAGLSIGDDVATECQGLSAKTALAQPCWPVYVHFGTLVEPVQPGSVHLVVLDAVAVTSPWSAMLRFADPYGRSYVTGRVTMSICDKTDPLSDALKQALQRGARDGKAVLVDPAWPLYTVFQSDQSYLKYSVCGAWTMERVLRAVNDLTYAQATGYRPVWYEDVDASLFEDPTETGVLLDDTIEFVYQMFCSECFRRSSDGQRLAEALRGIDCGPKDAKAFELWVADALEFLFGHALAPIHVKPNCAKATRRDIVARNNGSGPFFARLLRDYRASMLVFEVKNYAKPEAQDFRQVQSYLNHAHYGDIGFLVPHASTLEISDANWVQIREIYFGERERKLVLVLPSALLVELLETIDGQRQEQVDEAMQTWLERCLLEDLPL